MNGGPIGGARIFAEYAGRQITARQCVIAAYGRNQISCDCCAWSARLISKQKNRPGHAEGYVVMTNHSA